MPKSYIEISEINKSNNKYIALYENFNHQNTKLQLATLHACLINLFGILNNKLPTYNGCTNHFWADPSRWLIETIDKVEKLQQKLRNTENSFEVEPYNKGVIEKCKTFLSSNEGSTIPPNMEKIDLYYTAPIFIQGDIININSPISSFNQQLKALGEGSYANTYTYFDKFYNRKFVVKKAKKNLNAKEIERFRREFETMNKLKSPYVVEVYKYDERENRYIMEYMDYSLHNYINDKNTTLSESERKTIVMQILRTFDYLYSKKILHRDISPKNILLKLYDDVIIVKMADFGLVKIPDSELTSDNTEFKGYFNDPCLKLSGFNEYSIEHEIYALTMTIVFIMSGKTNITKITDNRLKQFAEKGLHPDKNKRYQSLVELNKAFSQIYQ